MKVVVLGAGFAGLRVARRIEGKAEVTLVAPEDFAFLPLLHEVLSETTEPPEVQVKVADVLRKTTVVRDRATSLEGNEVVLASGARLPFDRLVVAIGAEPADYGVPGVRDHALFFGSVRDALRGNANLKLAAANVRERPVRVAVVGGGFTGVEVAGEAAVLLDKLGVTREIQVLEAMPDVFPRQTPAFRDEIRAALKRLRIDLRTRQKILRVLPDGVVVADGDGEGKIEADVVFWCAGVRPRKVPGLDPEVDATLRSKARDDVWILGDAARPPKDLQVPLLAQTAEQAADVVAWNVLRPERPKAFHPNVRGLIVAVGHRHAVAEFADGRVVTGEIPWHVKRRLYKAKIAIAS